MNFFLYFDLSNQQIFLSEGEKDKNCDSQKTDTRISKGTWGHWQAGIKSHMQRKAFQQARSRIVADEEFTDFQELRCFVKTFSG